MSAWLHIVGVGEGGVDELGPKARLLIAAAQTVLGPKRLLSFPPLPIPPHEGEGAAPRVEQNSAPSTDGHLPLYGEGAVTEASASNPVLIEWRPPLENMLAQVEALRGTPTVILATGDPMWFGIGATLAGRLAPEEFVVHPLPSAFQLAAARMRWPLQNVTTVSLHGRPAEALHSHILPGNRVIALTSDRTTSHHVAQMLIARGYGLSIMSALEQMGGADERVVSGPAESWDADAIGDFHTLAIDCVASADAPLLPVIPGLPDDAFLTDGQLTKREVRAATLARLAPFPSALLWDVGAGCGSIAIEWMRAARDAEAIAFEREGERLQMIALNAAALGVPGLRIENGEAPQSLEGMPVPDAIFLGGGVADESLFEACWAALRPGGRIVANAVTIDGERALYDRQARLGGELLRIEVAALDKIGAHGALRPRMPVTQWAAVKP